jgi:hypothetical protein
MTSFKVPLLADGSDDSQDVEQAAQSTSSLHGRPPTRRVTCNRRAQHAWRRYQASVQPLNKQPEPTPRCHCGADAAKRIVKQEHAQLWTRILGLRAFEATLQVLPVGRRRVARGTR